jgi:probable blue pigment (indigoidine) exporter
VIAPDVTIAVRMRSPGGQRVGRSVLAGPVLGQRVPRAHVVAVVAGLAGIALVALTPQARLDGLGVLTGVGAAVATAAGIVLTRRWGRPVGVVTFTGWQLLAGGLVLLPLLSFEGLPTAPLTLANWAGLAWLALPGGAFAYLLLFDGIAHLRAVAVSSPALLAPVTAAVLGWLVLGQRLGVAQLLGAVVTLGAVLTLQVPPRRARTPEARVVQPACRTTTAVP